MARKDEIRASIAAHPEWMVWQHAEALGISPENLRSTMRYHGWKPPRAKARVPMLVLNHLTRDMFALIEEVAKGRSAHRDRAREIVIRAKGN